MLAHNSGMNNAIDALSKLAQSCYDKMSQEGRPDFITMPISADGVLNSLAHSVSTRFQDEELTAATSALAAEPDLTPFKRKDDGSTVMVFGPDGSGTGMNIESIASSLLVSAVRRSLVMRLPDNMSSFVGLVLENYEEVRRAGRGEPVRAYDVIGLTGVKLTDEQRVETPWGTIYPAPSAPPTGIFMSFVPQTTALLVKPRLANIVIQAGPGMTLPGPDTGHAVASARTRQLLPLAFALATANGERCAPLATFQTTLVPFSNGTSWQNFFVGGASRSTVEPTASQIVDFEVWSRRLEQQYPENLHVAGRRIVSAIAERIDRADSLIDAVTAWESMVGTGTETSFRVTAALSKLIEPDARNRRAFRKELSGIYAQRSRVVHGDPLDQPAVDSAVDRAIEIGLKSLAAILSGPTDLLMAKSGERADRLILEN